MCTELQRFICTINQPYSSSQSISSTTCMAADLATQGSFEKVEERNLFIPSASLLWCKCQDKDQCRCISILWFRHCAPTKSRQTHMVTSSNSDLWNLSVGWKNSRFKKFYQRFSYLLTNYTSTKTTSYEYTTPGPSVGKFNHRFLSFKWFHMNEHPSSTNAYAYHSFYQFFLGKLYISQSDCVCFAVIHK